MAEGVIRDENDYIRQVKETFLHPEDVKWKKFKNDFKQKHDRDDRMYYKRGNMWVDVFFENGKLSTAFVLSKKYEDILFKGDKATFEIIDIQIRDIR